jgi:drug/metabolite transporter (DMT)-like permease
MLYKKNILKDFFCLIFELILGFNYTSKYVIVKFKYLFLNGPFGGVVDLPSGVIAWGRRLFASIGLFTLLNKLKGDKLFSFHNRNDPTKMVLLGLFMSGNWYFFYVSIKIPSVAIAVVSLFTYPFVTLIIEPFFKLLSSK